MSLLPRRNALKIFGVAAVATTTGCLPLLFRLVVGRGMLRSLTQGAALGRSAATTSVGRGMAIASRAHSFTQLVRGIRTLEKFRSHAKIIDENGKEIAQIDAHNEIIECRTPSNTVVMRTGRNGPDVLEHYDLMGKACGYTKIISPTTHEHFDVDHKTIGFDEFIRDGVEHYDTSRRLLGTSRIVETAPDLYHLEVGNNLATNLEALMNLMVQSWPKADVEQRLRLLRRGDECRQNQRGPDCLMIPTLNDLAR